MTAPLPSPIPSSIDLRHLCQPVQNQGNRATCLAFATTAAHEAARFLVPAIVEDLAEEVLYWGCKQLDQSPIPGTTFQAASGALTTWGQPAEALWVYDPLRNDTDSSYQPPATAIDPSVCHRGSLLRIGPTTAAMKSELGRGRPVILGIQMSWPILQTADGHIAMPTPAEMLAEGHAMLVVGYDDGSSGQGEWMVRNSWGVRWGDAGYGYLPYRYVEQFGGEAWIMA